MTGGRRTQFCRVCGKEFPVDMIAYGGRSRKICFDCKSKISRQNTANIPHKYSRGSVKACDR